MSDETIETTNEESVEEPIDFTDAIAEEESPTQFGGEGIFGGDESIISEEEEIPSEDANTDEGYARDGAAQAEPIQTGDGEDGPIPAEDREWAKQMGLTDENINSFPNAESLRNLLTTIGTPNVTTVGDPEPKIPAPAQQQPAPQAAPAPDDLIKPFAAPLEFDDTWQEETVEVFNKMNTHYATQVAQQAAVIEQLNGGLSEIAQHLRFQAAAQDRRMVDAEIESLGESWNSVYGKGPLHELSSDSAEAKLRDDIYGRMVATADSYKRAGRPVPPFKALFRTAHFAVNGEKVDKVAKDEVHRKLQAAKKRVSRNAAGPASARVASVVKEPTEEAVGAVEEYIAALGGG